MKRFTWLPILLTCLFVHCSTNTIYKHIHTLPHQVWSRDNHLKFQFTITDNKHPYQIYLLLHATQEYPYQNLYTTYYLKNSQEEQLATALRDHSLFDKKTGKPLGAGWGKGKKHTLLLCEDYYFDAPGTYVIELVHFMRTENLGGILSVGIGVDRK